MRWSDKGRIRLEVTTWAASFIDFTGIAEMVGQAWKKVGIQIDVKEMERSLAVRRREANELPIELYENTGSETLWTNPQTTLPILPDTRLEA